MAAENGEDEAFLVLNYQRLLNTIPSNVLTLFHVSFIWFKRPQADFKSHSGYALRRGTYISREDLASSVAPVGNNG